MSSAEPEARTGTAQDPPKRSFQRRLAVWWLSEITYFSFTGAVLATIMMGLSTTPSLLPRGPLFQGIVTGFSGAAGYALGTFVAFLTRYLVSRDDPWPRPKDTWWAALAVVAGAGLAVTLYFYSRWQDQIRDLMGVPRLDWTAYPIIAATALLVYAVLMVSGQLWGAGVRALSRWLRKRVPPRIAALTSAFVMVVLTVFVVNGAVADYGMRALDNTFSSLNGETTPASSPPESPLRSGSPDSLVSWPSLGLTGRAFVGTGPTVEELTAFNGSPATEPIRVYSGVESADSPRASADLVARELERTGAFDREVLGIGFSTGTGWMNHATVDSLEYMYNGDTAIASMQYSVLPSWISFLVDTERARQAGVALFEAIDRRVRRIPEADRPKVVVFGESLGAYGAEAPFGSVQTLAARTDGAFLTGPTFSNTLWNDLTGNRDPGSPQWLPVRHVPPGVGGHGGGRQRPGRSWSHLPGGDSRGLGVDSDAGGLDAREDGEADPPPHPRLTRGIESGVNVRSVSVSGSPR